MLELGSTKKNKVSLQDYPCEQDIQNRMLLSDFSVFDVEVLEEVLYSPLRIPIKKLARQVGCDEDRLLPLLEKLARVNFLSFDKETITIDKELRKQFEFQLMRFDPDFKPDLEFLQGIMRKVPIHILPTWYSIPRTSNNIFESIVEKYLLTPHIYQRYLSELHFANPLVTQIMQDLFNAPDFTLSSSDVIAKYNLIRRDFEEILLLLEFHFIGCLSYRREEDHWVEVITPFHEWHQHLRFMKETEASPILNEKLIERTHKSDFAFVEEMSAILSSIKKRGKPLDQIIQSKAVEKLCLVRLCEIANDRLIPLEGAGEWLEMSLENKALYLYRHTLNRLPIAPTQVHVREAEKAIKRALHGRWVFFDDFMKGALVSVSEKSVVMLQKTGKQWKYLLPTYTDADKELIFATIFEWLFQAGMVAIGTCEGRDCFCVTAFGRFLFEE